MTAKGDIGLPTITSQTCHAKPKTQINRRRTLPASFRWGCLPRSLAWKTSPKVRTLWHCSRLRSVALYRDWSWWYPSGNRPLQQYLWASLPGAGYGQFEHKADSLIAKFKEAGGTVREFMPSRVTAIISAWLSASSSACHGLQRLPYNAALPTKPSATKMPENWSWRTRQLLTCKDASAWCCCARCKIHEGVSWC